MPSDEIPDSVEFTGAGGWIERWHNGHWKDTVDHHAPLHGVRVGYVVNEDAATAHVSLTLEWIHGNRRYTSPTAYGDRYTMRALANGILEALDELPDELQHMDLR